MAEVSRNPPGTLFKKSLLVNKPRIEGTSYLLLPKGKKTGERVLKPSPFAFVPKALSGCLSISPLFPNLEAFSIRPSPIQVLRWKREWGRKSSRLAKKKKNPSGHFSTLFSGVIEVNRSEIFAFGSEDESQRREKDRKRKREGHRGEEGRGDTLQPTPCFSWLLTHTNVTHAFLIS